MTEKAKPPVRKMRSGGMQKGRKSIEDSVAIGDIILAIASGHKTVSTIAEYLEGQAPASTLSKLQRLAGEKKGYTTKWLIKDHMNYELNKPVFVEYYCKKFGVDKEKLQKDFDVWMKTYAGLTKTFGMLGLDKFFNTTINSAGEFMKVFGVADKKLKGKKIEDLSPKKQMQLIVDVVFSQEAWGQV